MRHASRHLYTSIMGGLAQFGSTPALTLGGRAWSAKELRERVDSWADRLQQRGLAPNRTLRWSAEDDGVDALCARLAAWKLDADFVAGDAPPDGDIAATARAALDRDASTATPALCWLDSAICDLAAPPIILGALTDGAALAVLACWHSCRAATHVTLRHGIGKTLAALEQLSPPCVVLPENLIGALATHPSATLSDLESVSLVIIVRADPPTRFARMVGTLFPSARCVSLHDGAAYADSPPPEREEGALQATLQACVCQRLEQAFHGMAWSLAADAARELGETALLSMLHALAFSGLFTQEGASHTVEDVLLYSHCAPAHETLVRRWLRVLIEARLLMPNDGRLQLCIKPSAYSDIAMAQAWEHVTQMWTMTANGALTIDYARRNAQCLPELITGTQKAVNLLFPQGDATFAQALYRESPAARYQHRAMAELARCTMDSFGIGRRIRVLEVGAGTGATTDVVRPRLAGLDMDYLYTDVSPYFISQAQLRYAGDSAMRYGLYDMDLPPQAQNYSPGSFDLIICGGALNAARNTDATLQGLCVLLTQGGWLLLSEPTREEFWVMASQAFMLGDASDARTAAESTFLTREQWHTALDGTGLNRVADLPPDGHPLQEQGHRVFAAQKSNIPGSLS